MIGCMRTHVRKQPIVALYFESENEVKFYNLEAWLILPTTLYRYKPVYGTMMVFCQILKKSIDTENTCEIVKAILGAGDSL